MYTLSESFASLTPAITPTVEAKLTQSIADFGVLMPVYVWKETCILLDGYDRDSIIKKLRKEGKTVDDPVIVYQSFATEAEATQFRVDLYRARKTSSDAARIIHAITTPEIMEPLRAAADKRKKSGKSNKTLGSGEPKGRVDAIIAEAVEASKPMVKRLRKVQAERPELLPQVAAGEMTVESAHQEAKKKADARRIKKLVAELPPIPPAKEGELLDTIHCCDVMDGFKKVATGTVDLIVTSPIYPLKAIEYHMKEAGFGRFKNYEEYLAWCNGWMIEGIRTLKWGGRFTINYADCNIPVDERTDNRVIYQCSTDFSNIMRTIADAVYLGRIIWYKQKGNGNRANNGAKITSPRLDSPYEYIDVWQKGSAGLKIDKALIDTTDEEHANLCMGHWYIPPQSKTAKGIHRCPYPMDVPMAVMKLFTTMNAVILDPFMGSGTTACSAKQTHRHFIGFELDPAYVAESIQRLAKITPGNITMNVRQYHRTDEAPEEPKKDGK